ncbi:rCG34255 [Rattus norvegicus]|uniref:RCG34255 n=1 Tax=Rattus norvegicus TaxID=10116 RepID=A6HKF3_RAT|nr:rCG34255 [Rattus norvegicus]
MAPGLEAAQYSRVIQDPPGWSCGPLEVSAEEQPALDHTKVCVCIGRGEPTARSIFC